MPDNHEIRELKYKLKTLAKQNGRQGETIHRLRAELAEVREINGRIARGVLRDLERTVVRQNEMLDSHRDEIDRLREKLQSLTNNTSIVDNTSVADEAEFTI